MKCFTIEEARRIVADFQKYVGLSTNSYSVFELLITPCNDIERIQFVVDYRDKKQVSMNSARGCDVVVGLKSADGHILDIPVREFCETHQVPYAFPA